MTKRRSVLLLVFLLVGLLAACGDDNEASDSESEELDTDALIEEAATQIDEAQSFELVLQVDGAPVFLNGGNVGLDIPVTFQEAVGPYVAPDALQAVVTVMLEDVAADVDIIVIDDAQYLKHILITGGRWQQSTFLDGFNPRNLTEGDNSIAQALRSMENVEYVGETDLDGLPVHHLRGQVEAAQVSAVTVGLIGMDSGMINADIYIRTRDNRLEQMVIEEPVEDDQTSIWTISLYDYNGDYAVTAPEVSE